MRTPHSIEPPLSLSLCPPLWATELPALRDLNNEPQIAPVALLQAAADITIRALQSRHGIGGDPSDEVFEHPDCSAPFIARMVLLRCRELWDLLTAYRIALRRDCRADDHDDF